MRAPDSRAVERRLRMKFNPKAKLDTKQFKDKRIPPALAQLLTKPALRDPEVRGLLAEAPFGLGDYIKYSKNRR